MNVVFMGTPDFAVPSLKALIENGFSVSAVVTQPDRPVGRKRIITPPPVKPLALRHHIEVLQPERVREQGFIEKLALLKPDIIAVVAFGQILPEELLELPTMGCINVHASLLPKYRGAAPIQWALIQGEKTTGITTMWMDRGLDTGDIFLQESISIDSEWTGEDLFRELSTLGGKLLVKTLNEIKKGNIRRIPQGNEGVSYAPMLKKEDGFIDWNKGAEEIADLIRGLYPWPGTYTVRGRREVKIWKAKPYKDCPRGNPGTYVGKVEGKGFLVGTAEGCLLVEELQEVGKNRISATDYLLGHPMIEGDGFADV